MSDWLEHSDNANTLKSSYIQGVLDVSGNIIMRNSEQTFINMSDASFNRKFHALKNTAIGKEVDNLENALDVSGNVGITGSLVLDEAPTIYGSLNTDQLSIEGNLITTGGTSIVASKNVTYDTHLNVHDSTITANTSELNHMNKHLNLGHFNPVSDAKVSITADDGVLQFTKLSYDGNVMAFNKSAATFALHPTTGNVNSFQGILVFQKMYLTQLQWDERTKSTNIPSSASISNYILTDDTSLDTSKQYWTQLGSNIRLSFARYCFDLNGDGTRLVSNHVAANVTPNGGFIVMEYSTPGLLGGTWDAISSVPTGSDVTPSIPPNGGSFVGPSDTTYNRTAINYSGNRVIVSDRTHDNGSGTYGTAQVFEYSGSGTTWNLIGEFYGDSSYGTSAFAYNTQAINKSPDPAIDGMFIALNHLQNPEALASGAVTSSGSSTVQIYHYSGDGTTWNQVGGTINGEYRGQLSWNSSSWSTQGASWASVDLSSDGKTIVMGSGIAGHNNTNGLNVANTHWYAGNNIVYEYRKITQSEWDNGNISAPYYPTLNQPLIMADGDTTLDLNKEYWIQMGNNMYGDKISTSPYGSANWGGTKIAKTDDGRTYIITNEAKPTSGTAGQMHIWQFINNDWEKIAVLVGETGEYMGLSNEPGISGNGRFVSTGTSYNYTYIFDTNNAAAIDYKYKIHNDVSMVNAAESFGEDVSLNAALTVPGDIYITENLNSEYNYGAYTIHTDETYTNYFAVGKSASNVFNIVNNNNAGVYMDSGSNSFTGTSDERLKKNIEEIKDESNEKVKQLRPVTYQWKHQTHDKSQAGFIAQEVEKVLPELVKENDSIDGAKYKGVSSDDLIPYLVKYVQKLRKKLEILKETKVKKSASLSEISVSTNGGSINPSPFSSTDELK